jgi:uncharacterized protein YeaO (DUF488 family)
MTAGPRVRFGRVYDGRSAADGTRVLVDRLWPRGLAKDAGQVDEWAKTVAPSADLRRWYGHEPAKFAGFRRRYRAELRGAEQASALDHMRDLARTGPVTLVTATRDIEHSQAAVLAELLGGQP